MGSRLTQQVLRVRTTNNPNYLLLDDYMPTPSDPFNDKYTIISACEPQLAHVHLLDYIQVVQTPNTVMPEFTPSRTITIYSKRDNSIRLLFEIATSRKFGDSVMLTVANGSCIPDKNQKTLQLIELQLAHPLAATLPLTECRYNFVAGPEKIRVAYAIWGKARERKIMLRTASGMSPWETVAFVSAVVQTICLSNPCVSFTRMIARDAAESTSIYVTRVSDDIGQVRVNTQDALCYIELPVGFRYFDQYGVLLLENYYRIKALQAADVPEWLRLELLCIYLTKQFELLCKSAANGADPLRVSRIRNARDAYLSQQTLQVLVTEVSSVLPITWPSCLTAELFGKVLVTTRNSFVHSYDNPVVWNAKHPMLSSNHIPYLSLLSVMDQACTQVTKVLWEVKK